MPVPKRIRNWLAGRKRIRAQEKAYKQLEKKTGKKTGLEERMAGAEGRLRELEDDIRFAGIMAQKRNAEERQGKKPKPGSKEFREIRQRAEQEKGKQEKLARHYRKKLGQTKR